MPRQLVPLHMGGNAITNLPTTPSGTNDAASKSYVDSQVGTKQNSSTALTNLAAVVVSGSLHRTGTDTYASRTLTGTTNLITVTNGDGVAGNPTITIGTSVARLDTNQTFSGIKTFSAAPIFSTLTGYLKGNGVSAITASATIPIADISATGTPSSTTYLRGDGTWAAVTGGSGDVSGPASSVNGNVATFSGTSGKVLQDSGKSLPSGTLVGTSDSQALTNKTLTDATNTVAFRRVIHGATASTARPNATHVEWVGSVAPTNANTTNDTWIDTA